METVDEIIGYDEPCDDLNRLAYAVIGAALEVHIRLGPGHAEVTYENAMCIKLGLRGLRFVRQHVFEVKYRDQVVGKGRVDLLVEDSLIVEIKAVAEIAAIHVAQTVSYLRAMKLSLGLVINFNVRRLKDGGVRRIAETRSS